MCRVCRGVWGVRRCAQVWAGMHKCTRVCMGVHGCGRECIGVRGCVQVCVGVLGCERVCTDVRGYAWVCVCMNFQNFFWRKESLHQRTLIPILYDFLYLYFK